MIVIVLLSVIYALFLVVLIFAWLKIEETENEKSNSNTWFSVIVAARNEEQNIIQLLKSLTLLNYQKHQFEVIIVDDHSEDHTFTLANEFISRMGLTNFYVILNNKNKAGKKAAISQGIAKSKFEWIVTTDADCLFSSEWLTAFDNLIQKEKPYLVSAPVIFSNENSFFEKIQSLEFAGLIGIGAGLIRIKKPQLSNGANMAYLKEKFLELDGFEGNDKIASGDDTFLLKKVSEAYPDKIRFLKNKNAIVSTKAHAYLSKFLMQRKRWVAKTKRNKWSDMLVPAFVWVFHLALLFTALISLFSVHFLEYFLFLLGAKIIFEFPFALSVALFLGKKRLLIYYLPAAIIYIFYVSIIPLLSVSTNFQWKGRFYNQ